MSGPGGDAGATSSGEGATLSARIGRLFVIFMCPSLGGFVPLAIAVAQPAMAAHIGDGTNGTLIARLTLSLASLMVIIGAPLAGFLAERVGYRRSLLVSLLVYGLAGSVGLLVPERIGPDDSAMLAVLMGSRMVLGLAAGSIMAIYLALTAHYYEGVARARVLGFAVAASSLAGVFALNVSGRLVDWGGWRAPFVLYLLAFVVLAAAWFMINPAKRSSAAMAADRADVASMRAALGLLWPIYAVLIILSVGTFALSEGGPFLLQANGMTRATIQGVILSVGQLPAILTASAYGFMRRYVDDRMILTASAVLMGLGLMVIVPIRDPAILTVALVIFGLGSGLKAPAVSSALLAGAPGNVRAAAAGLIFSAIFLGQFLTPLLIEGLDRIVAIHGTFVVFGVALLLVAVFVYFGGIGKALPKQ